MVNVPVIPQDSKTTDNLLNTVVYMSGSQRVESQDSHFFPHHEDPKIKTRAHFAIRFPRFTNHMLTLVQDFFTPEFVPVSTVI